MGFKGKLGVKYQVKDYAGTPRLDENGEEVIGETREDTRTEYLAYLSKRFKTGWLFPARIDIFFSYMYRDNLSNDPYYAFKDHIGLLGFTVGL